MKIIDLLSKLIAGPFEVAGHAYDSYLAARQRKLELANAIHKKRLELVSQGLAADAQWEMAQIANSGIKDDVVLYVLLAPFVAAFCPFLAPHVLNGFEIVSKTPLWYQGMFVTVGLAVFGIRRWRRKQEAGGG